MPSSAGQVRVVGEGEIVAKVATQVATPPPAYPVRAVGKHREIVRVPSPPRTEWGLTEAQLAVGYAQCAGGVA